MIVIKSTGERSDVTCIRFSMWSTLLSIQVEQSKGYTHDTGVADEFAHQLMTSVRHRAYHHQRF
jgi:hypothetical protein